MACDIRIGQHIFLYNEDKFNRGDRKAFEHVYRELYPQIYFFACSLVGMEDAKDIASDAFLHLWSREKNFPTLQKIKTYLQVCVRNASINHLQKAKFREDKASEIAGIFDSGLFDEDEVEHVRSVLLKTIASEIEKLPPRAKKIFKLSFIDGLNSKKIASMLGISHSTVRNQKQRALQIIRAALQKSDLFILTLISSFIGR